jgi:hypothetical protein
MAELLTFAAKDATTSRDDMCRTMKNGLLRLGVAEPNVGPNSEWFVLFTAVGNEVAFIGANGVIKADQAMPDTAEGADLQRSAAIFNLYEQEAGGSIGAIVLESSAISPVVTSTELTDVAGLRYRVTVGGNYGNGDEIPIEAIDVGDATNHAEGDVLQWASAPPFASDKVTVAIGGLINGIETENSEVLRSRELAVLQNPPGAGNPEHFAETAEKSTPRVQKSFVYPAALGPSTVRVAVTAAPTKTNKNREVASTILNGIVAPYVIGKMPGHAHIGVTTVESVPVDVAFAISLAEAPTANPPGLGGGWLNGTPWPAPNGVTTFRCSVTAVEDTKLFTVDAVTPPTPNVTRIAWLSPLDWKLYTALVTEVSGVSEAYEISIDRPFVGLMEDALIWPESQNAQAYVDSVIAQFAVMGPGELTANPSALARGFRHPPASLGWPMALGPHLLNRLTDDEDDVLAAQYFYRTDGATPISGSIGQLLPAVPATIALPPKQFVPRHIAFYRIP